MFFLLHMYALMEQGQATMTSGPTITLVDRYRVGPEGLLRY